MCMSVAEHFPFKEIAIKTSDDFMWNDFKKPYIENAHRTTHPVDGPQAKCSEQN